MAPSYEFEIVEHSWNVGDIILADDPLQEAFSFLSGGDLFLVGCVNKRFLRVSNNTKLWQMSRHLRQWGNRNMFAKYVYGRHQAKLRQEAEQRRTLRNAKLSTAVNVSSYGCFGIAVGAFICFFILISNSLLIALIPLLFGFLCCIPQVMTTVAALQDKSPYGGHHFGNSAVFLAAASISTVLIFLKLLQPQLLGDFRWLYCLLPFVLSFCTILYSGIKSRDWFWGSLSWSIFIFGNFLVFLVGFRLDNVIDWNWALVLIPLYVFSVIAIIAFAFGCLMCFLNYSEVFDVAPDDVANCNYLCCVPVGCCSSIVFPVMLVLHLNKVLEVPDVALAVLCFAFLVPAIWCIIIGFLGVHDYIELGSSDD